MSIISRYCSGDWRAARAIVLRESTVPLDLIRGSRPVDVLIMPHRVHRRVMAPMLEDLLKRRPYNAVTDFVDANVARGLGDQDRIHGFRANADLCAAAGGSCRFASALRALGLREENRAHPRCSTIPSITPSRSGGDPRRHHSGPDQYAAHRRAIRLSARRQPGGRGHRRGCARAHAALDPPRLPHLRAVIVVGATPRSGPSCRTCCSSTTCWRTASPRRSPRRRCRTRSRSGCTRRARPAIPRRSSTSIPA